MMHQSQPLLFTGPQHHEALTGGERAYQSQIGQQGQVLFWRSVTLSKRASAGSVSDDDDDNHEDDSDDGDDDMKMMTMMMVTMMRRGRRRRRRGRWR